MHRRAVMLAAPPAPMHPLVRACLGLSALSVLGAFGGAEPLARPAPSSASVADSTGPTTPEARCPRGSLPDADVCVGFEDVTADEGGELAAEGNWHVDRSGQLVQYEQVPRAPERPTDYNLYRYPLPMPPGGSFLLSGYDLDKPDDRQRRGPHLRAVGHGGVDLVAPRGAEIRAIALEHQEGDAEVAYVGPLFGNTVVTRHQLREGGRLRAYVLVFGHLQGPALGLRPGQPVHEGDLLGFVGDSGSEGLVHLHLEARRVRDNEDPRALSAGQLTAQDRTIAVDPRNVLPLR